MARRPERARARTGVSAETKADDSPVTVADRKAERLLRRLIAERYPDDGILGEEYGEERAGASLEDVLRVLARRRGLAVPAGEDAVDEQ